MLWLEFSSLGRSDPVRPQWRHRYAPEVTENLEHAFALELPAVADITLNPTEHAAYEWLGSESAAAKAWS